MVGRGRNWRGIGGRPRDSEEREMKTNVWSVNGSVFELAKRGEEDERTC